MSETEKQGVLKQRGYINISMPKRIADIINKEMIESDKYGYRSVSEFVTEAARIRLRDLGCKV